VGSVISVRMNKKKGIFIGIAFVFLFTGIALATSNDLSDSSDVIVYAFDQNHAGYDSRNEKHKSQVKCL
jgi:hypothetical protein